MIVFHQASIQSPDHQDLFFIEKFVLDKGHRYGLIGPNGSGKTTFFSQCAKLPSVLLCPQKIPAPMQQMSWNDAVASLEGIFDYDGFYQTLELFEIPADCLIGTLSGGQQRIGLLAWTLFQHANHYLLDEPTNHLDLKGILWLEDYLSKNEHSILIISHDRAFLDNVVSGYWAIYDKKMRFYPGQFEDFLLKREQEEATLAQERTKKVISLAQEERYRERGVTARRKRNQKRVQRLYDLRAELSATQASSSKMRLDLVEFQNKGHKAQRLIEIKNYNLFDSSTRQNFTATLTRADRIALVGPNGCGKTTFLKGILNPDDEQVIFCRSLKVAYIDQQRRYDPEKTLLQHLSIDPHQMTIETPQGEQQVHPAVYLQRFGFLPDDLTTPYGQLSGGQQMKMALALSFVNYPDVLVLDEPTNDLDQESLEDLADWLGDYQGLVLFVSHDRYFIDQCATATWYWTAAGLIAHSGGVDADLLNKTLSFRRTQLHLQEPSGRSVLTSKSKSECEAKLLVKELAKIEKELDKLENEIKKIDILLSQAYENSNQDSAIKTLLGSRSSVQKQLDALWEEWEHKSSIQ